MPGTLFVVATPIGNLEDLSFRALRTLKEVDLIAAEDTRRTAKLLAHYEIRKSMVSLREHNETRETPRLLERLEKGENIALVSDAGTPGIADPGAKLVAACHGAGIRVSPIPGPSAVAAALSASGVPGDQYVFLGFPPSSGKSRQVWLEDLRKQSRTAVFFEAPHRIRRTVEELSTVNRPIFIFREISKIHETLVIRSKHADAAEVQELGEFCVVVPGEAHSDGKPVDSTEAFELYLRLISGEPMDRDEAISVVAATFGMEQDQAAKMIKKAKILADRQSRSRS